MKLGINYWNIILSSNNNIKRFTHILKNVLFSSKGLILFFISPRPSHTHLKLAHSSRREEGLCGSRIRHRVSNLVILYYFVLSLTCFLTCLPFRQEEEDAYEFFRDAIAKYHKLEGLKPRKHSLTVSVKSKCQQGQTSREGSFLATSSFWYVNSFLGLW